MNKIAPKITIIIGQTAIGKSLYALNLAIKTDAEIISCDSMQIYKEMDIGTDKPIVEFREKIPHHMIDIIYPDEKYSASQYGIDARNKIKEIKKNIIIVGGSGLYLRSLIDGIFICSVENYEIRKRLQDEAIKFGCLFEKLKKIDPQTKIHPNDTRRIIRALEVYELTGFPISELQQKGNYDKLTNDYEIIGLICNKEKLHKNIDARIDRMIKNGLIDEVQNLSKKYSKDLVSMQALAYKEIIGYLEKQYDFNKMIEILKYRTYQFAKRQLTWFKKNPKIKWLEV